MAKLYTNCDKCNPNRKYPYQFVTLVYRNGKPIYLCDECRKKEHSS